MYWQRRTDTTFACPMVGRRDLENRQKQHREKIASMKSAIDTRPPAPQPHLTLYGRDYVAKKRATTEAAFSDLKMIQSIARTMTRRAELPARAGPVSLNAGARKQEIYHIMQENNRLLNSLEHLEPVVSTRELLKQSRGRQRYIINSSHSKRLSGEYDSDIERIHTEDQNKLSNYRTNVEAKRSRAIQASSGSSSMPNLMPAMSQTAPAATSSMAPAGAASPHIRKVQKRGAPTSELTSPSSTGGDDRRGNEQKGKVQFNAAASEGTGSPGPRKPATPHPGKGGLDAEPTSEAEEMIIVDDQVISPAKAAPPPVVPPTRDAAADSGVSPTGSMKAAPAAADESYSSKEFDPSSATADATEENSGVGLPAADAAEDYEEDYEDDDFAADDSQLSPSGGAGTSKPDIPTRVDETFEEDDDAATAEQSATFEDSKAA